ncbi:hypothetical protein [Actinomycetospora sp. TBRC 11914]|uniref:hypothetical protein n=1 Tax=Actinomycetospora sp. TBRC 11914 TaxID=2729387 RepID=UPI00145ED700|nr:hypothetical protein [Actinomycetospora sp. TBRC 11914]NMO92576.1 hypothetical protein [Actinomycetospora sp. TBRC 11914]
MSMIRKTVLTTAIIGAGLASTAGAAFAGDDPGDGGNGGDHQSHSSSSHHHSWHASKDSSGCSNSFQGETGSSKNVGGLLNDAQGAIGLNVCDVLSHNNVLNDNHLKVL